MDQDDLVFFNGLIDDPAIALAGRVQTCELAHYRLSQSLRFSSGAVVAEIDFRSSCVMIYHDSHGDAEVLLPSTA
jgi:hypothetical protein